MVIEGDFYKLTSINDHSDFFDLELLYQIKGKNPRKEFKIAAYGIPLRSAIKHIIRYCATTKLPEKVSLKTYLETYIKAEKAIEKQFS